MKVLILNQAFYPDVVSTAQHASDLAVRLAEIGHHVEVIASSRAYDNPNRIFPRRERWNGMEIRRIPTLGLGKRAKWRRAADFAWFLLCCAGRLAITPRQDAVIALTSPPLIAFLATLFVRWKGGRLVYWNLFAPRSRPEHLAGRLRPLSKLAEAQHARDRAFFYSRLVVEEVVA